MSVKLIHRAAIAGAIAVTALTLSAQAAFGAPADEPVAPTTPSATEAAAAEASAAAESAPAPEVSIAIPEISLDGPAIAEVGVTVSNDSDAAMRSVEVSFDGPVGWQVVAVENDLGKIDAGDQEAATFQVRIPEERSGFALRIFSAGATYKGGDGEGSVGVTRGIPTAAPLADLATAYNNTAITSESAPTAGDFDGEGNSFSAEKLAAAGAGQGAELQFLGATLQMPTVEPGTPDNVASAGQAVELSGKGERVVFLGSGSSTAATGSATVYYTDGSTSTGSFGFPNWSFHEADAHGAQLAVSTDGRNRPSGYGDAAYQYRLFVNSVPLDPSKEVDFVILPGNATLHVFDMAIAP